MEFCCLGVQSFESTVEDLQECADFERLDEYQKETVLNLVRDWFEASIDDAVYRIYDFPYDSGLEPYEYFEVAKDTGIYRELTYEYDVKYPDFALVAKYTF